MVRRRVPGDRITVLMPVKDCASTVGRALRSTLRALPADARVIVRSDSSTDGTVRAVRDVADSRVTVEEGEESIGVVSSLNRMLEQVDTPLVARMDGDDLCLPWRFRAQLRRIARGDDFVFATTPTWRERQRRLGPAKPLAISPRGARLALLVENGFAHPTMLARADVMRELGGYRPVPSEDYDLWLRAALADFRISRVAAPGVIYRIHDSQVTADPGWQRDRARDNSVVTLVEQLARRVLGFTPGFIRWRKSGFDATAVPAALADEVAAVREAAASLPWSDRLVVTSRLRQIARHA